MSKRKSSCPFCSLCLKAGNHNITSKGQRGSKQHANCTRWGGQGRRFNRINHHGEHTTEIIIIILRAFLLLPCCSWPRRCKELRPALGAGVAAQVGTYWALEHEHVEWKRNVRVHDRTNCRPSPSSRAVNLLTGVHIGRGICPPDRRS